MSAGVGLAGGSASGGLLELGCPGGQVLLSSGHCGSAADRSSNTAAGNGWSDWIGDWWLIPLLVVLVVLCERSYTLCRRHIATRSGSVDSSEFSALQQIDTADGMDDEDEEVNDNGLSDNEADERHSTSNHSTATSDNKQQQQQQQQQQKQTGSK